jgi:hypothetical protein
VDQYRDYLDVVRVASQYPVFDFELDYRQGLNMRLPHLTLLKLATQRLAIDAQCKLRRGDAAGSTANIEVMLKLVKATAGERLPISQAVRMLMARISVEATWELLETPNVSDSQLAAIQRGWTGLSFIQPAEDSLTMERATTEMTLERMRISNSRFDQIFGGDPLVYQSPIIGEAAWNNFVLGCAAAYWRTALAYPDELRALKGRQVILDAFREVRGGKSFVAAIGLAQARLAELGLNASSEGFFRMDPPSFYEMRSLFSESVTSINRMLNKVFAVEAARNISVTALALKRYQLGHGQYPANLSELVPEFLQAVPSDPADGQPLRYHPRTDGTFLLYSVGDDGVDNGGDATTTVEYELLGWLQGRDIVWPQPATPEEINTYWRNRAKEKYAKE